MVESETPPSPPSTTPPEELDRKLRNAKRRARAARCPSEFREQLDLARWLDVHPVLRSSWFHVPNGGWRGSRTGYWLSRAGVKPGVPDVLVIAPCIYEGQPFVGVALELKRRLNYRASPSQRHWLQRFDSAGWLSVICRGAPAAVELLERVFPLELAGGPPIQPSTLSRSQRLEALQTALLTPEGSSLSNFELSRRFGLSTRTVHAARVALKALDGCTA